MENKFHGKKEAGEFVEEKANVIKEVCELLLSNKKEDSVAVINKKYKFDSQKISKRSYTESQKMKVFIRDGFIDRYKGQRLVIPGILKVISTYFPDDFPYQPHWKMNETHLAYWELVPTIDHINPIALGGADEEENWVTTSMMNNSIKSNWTLEQLGWKVHISGNMKEWDGLTNLFMQLVEADSELLKDNYIKSWYKTAKKYMK